MEGAIPAKGNAFGGAGGVGRGETRDQTQNTGGTRGLAELYPRFRGPDRQQQGAQGPLGGPPSLAKSAVQAGAEAPAARLSEPARSIAALLTREHAAEDDEAAAGKRLAARFVRRPEDEACPVSGGSPVPYLAAAAFILLAVGGAAFYFLRPESSGTTERAASAYVPALFSAPLEVGTGAPQAQAAPAWGTQNSGAGTAQGTDTESWAEAVQNFRALAGAGSAGTPGEGRRTSAGATGDRLPKQYGEIACRQRHSPMRPDIRSREAAGHKRHAAEDNLPRVSILAMAALALGARLHIFCAVR